MDRDEEIVVVQSVMAVVKVRAAPDEEKNLRQPVRITTLIFHKGLR